MQANVILYKQTISRGINTAHSQPGVAPLPQVELLSWGHWGATRLAEIRFHIFCH